VGETTVILLGDSAKQRQQKDIQAAQTLSQEYKNQAPDECAALKKEEEADAGWM
jgi:hypothetical protein